MSQAQQAQINDLLRRVEKLESSINGVKKADKEPEKKQDKRGLFSGNKD